MALTEVSLVGLAVTGWRRRFHAPADATVYAAYLRKGYAGTLGAFVGVVIVETVAMHLLVRRWSDAAVWLPSALSIYSLGWLLGDHQGLRLNPHVVTTGCCACGQDCAGARTSRSTQFAECGGTGSSTLMTYCRWRFWAGPTWWSSSTTVSWHVACSGWGVRDRHSGCPPTTSQDSSQTFSLAASQAERAHWCAIARAVARFAHAGT